MNAWIKATLSTIGPATEVTHFGLN